MRNLSYENEFCMQFYFRANQNHFHKNGCGNNGGGGGNTNTNTGSGTNTNSGNQNVNFGKRQVTDDLPVMTTRSAVKTGTRTLTRVAAITKTVATKILTLANESSVTPPVAS